MYKIKKYTYEQAKKYNVEVRPSKLKNKKIDVYKNNIKVASIGDINYLDYPSYLENKGKEYADERRRLYQLRHAKDKKVVNSPGYWASILLW